MNFKDYWKSVPKTERVFFAARVGASYSTLNQVAFGDRVISADISANIERETAGAVTIADLRPAFAESLAAAGYIKSKRKSA